jgi:hypothetical protein
MYTELDLRDGTSMIAAEFEIERAHTLVSCEHPDEK